MLVFQFCGDDLGMKGVQHLESVGLPLITWFLPFPSQADSVANEWVQHTLPTFFRVHGEWLSHDHLQKGLCCRGVVR